jgi:hypothetical protein
MDDVLDNLQWRPGARHAERMARLAPRGAAPGMEQLAGSETYRAALRDLAALDE